MGGLGIAHLRWLSSWLARTWEDAGETLEEVSMVQLVDLIIQALTGPASLFAPSQLQSVLRFE